MRELTINEIELVSGAQITANEAAGLSMYYAGLGGVTASFGITAGFAPVCFALSAGFGIYYMMIA